jgi:hypothetical protein
VQTSPCRARRGADRAGVVEAAIRVGGLADVKAARLRDILNTLVAERGECSLEHLRELPDDDVKAQLIRRAARGGTAPRWHCPLRWQ